MDEKRFDSLTQRLSEGSGSRRGVIRGLTASVVGMALGLASHDEVAAKKCKKGHERCHGVCKKRCPGHSQSKCCGGHFPTCCPRNTLLHRACCGPHTVCCKPSHAFPDFPDGYCCNEAAGYICSSSGTPCVLHNGFGGLSIGPESQGTAPGYN